MPYCDVVRHSSLAENTSTKWAQGNADTLALSQLCKRLGLPIVAAPCDYMFYEEIILCKTSEAPMSPRRSHSFGSA